MPLETDFSLTTLNTLRLSARAALYLYVDNPALLHQLPPHHRRFVLGGGSNLVLVDDFDGLVLHAGLKGKGLAHEDSEAWYVEAACGEDWHDFVLWTLAQGWPGLENLAYIPGTVGAAPIQNIGAYGLEVGERIHEVQAIDLESGAKKIFKAADCYFAYRHSLWKREGWHLSGRFLITSVIFRLPKIWQPRCQYSDVAAALEQAMIDTPTPLQIANAITDLRQRKLPDPSVLPNAGSFFENPIVDAAVADALTIKHPQLPRYPLADGRFKLAAGWLIEQTGWKGRRLGEFGMYEKQALVLIHHGGGNAKGLLALVTAIQHAVAKQFGINLTPEPVFVGPSSAKNI